MFRQFAGIAALTASALAVQAQPLDVPTPAPKATLAPGQIDPERLLPNTTFITRANFEKEVAQSKGPVLVYFGGATWCGPCIGMKPVNLELAQNAGKDYRMVNVDTLKDGDDAVWRKELRDRYGFMGVPTYMMFKDGKPVAKHTGMAKREEIMQWLDGALKATTPLPPPPPKTAASAPS